MDRYSASMVEDQLTRHALHDPLTGLPTRSLFLDRLDHAVSRLRKREMVAVVFIELEGLDTTRLAYGRTCADDLLVQVGRRMELCMRAGDTLARLTGDEFTLLLEDLDEPTDVAAIAERLIMDLGRPFSVSGHDLSVSASVGVAFGAPGVTSAGDLLRQADVALYRAKAKGANRFVVLAAS